jgi:poly(A) polymerase
VTTSADLAKQIIASLRSRGHIAYLVGGCVRDLLLKITPKDFDVATDAQPESVLSLYPDAQQVGAHFGVVLVCRDEAKVEVATFRSDHDYQDGRHPSRVKFERDPRQDALRRDFARRPVRCALQFLHRIEHRKGHPSLAARNPRSVRGTRSG